MTIPQFTATLNEWGHASVPFFFMVDFEMKKPVVIRLNEIDPRKILFKFNTFTNASAENLITSDKHAAILGRHPLSFGEYQIKFENVSRHLFYGDSFLTNLTCKTEVRLGESLHNLFFVTSAPYKLYYRDEFLVFSPEKFVTIKAGKIFSYPMKGTIDAAIPNAAERILNDRKELAEHITIVDLIRNDLSQVASEVTVARFRYIDTIRTNHKDLLQVSSEITGALPVGYKSSIGDILVRLLPAGSISGAPKPKTVDIIREAEMEERGYYTGVFGYFDGENLESAVMIRYIENVNNVFYYRSGGGITTQSEVKAEYQEVIDKVYVPFD